MKRCIFIVEDRLTDIAGYLRTLHVVLGRGLCDESETALDDTSICFLHICWDTDDDTRARNTSRFKSIFQSTKDEMEANSFPAISRASYVPVVLKKNDYDPSEEAISPMIETIIGEQKAYLETQGFDLAFVEHFPEVSEDDDGAYILLLDIILNQPDNRDQGRIQSGKPVLSSCIYKRFPKELCIAYTNYRDYYGDKWAAVAEVTNEKELIRRELLTRPRAIYIPFKNRLYQALHL